MTDGLFGAIVILRCVDIQQATVLLFTADKFAVKSTKNHLQDTNRLIYLLYDDVFIR